MSDPSSPRVLDLFCGAGGLSEGFRQAGFTIVGGIDFDEACVRTFARNHPSALAVRADIADVGPQLLDEIGPVDVLVGGPSCQGFSTHGKRQETDPRNQLFREYLRIAEYVMPKWIVMENVKGMLTFGKGKFLRQITDGLRRLGYSVDARVLLAADYGVPQLRERVIVIASLEHDVVFPEVTHDRDGYVTVAEAIGDLPSLGTGGGEAGPVSYGSRSRSAYQREMRRQSRRLTLHKAKPVSDLALSLIRHIEQGHGVRSLPDHLLPDRFKKMRTISNGALRKDCTTLYYRLAWDQPAYTITTYFRNPSSGPFVHPADDRALSPREAARLQSFPDHYEFEAPGIPRQIGNAVPPLLARAIAEALQREDSSLVVTGEDAIDLALPA
jgi:DNA (cytosine-5)-methyltransferase 1